MSVPLVAHFADVISPDALVAHWHDLVDYARSDTVGFGFWTAVWVGSFCITFLLLRMLFTRWGETNVTQKTMALSLLAHLVLALLSTRMVFHQQGGSPWGRGIARETIVRPVRRAVIDAETSSAGRLPGRAPVWEQPPSLPTDAAARLEKPAAGESPPVVPERTATLPVEAPVTALPDVAVAGPAPPAPAPERAAISAPRAAPAVTEPLSEETAQARSDVNPGQGPPVREVRTTTEVPVVEPARTPRRQSASAAPAAAPVPPAAVSSPTSEPKAMLARTPQAGAPVRSEGPAPAPIAEPASPGSDQSTGTAPPAESKTFTRTGRRAAEDAPRVAAERVRTAERPSLADASRIPIAAARPGNSVPFSEGPTPEIVRPDASGAFDKDAPKVPAPYRLRGLPQRKKFAIDMGATEDSERAVEASLHWLARHQHPRGYWQPLESTLGHETGVKFNDPEERQRSGFQAESGLTALALLAFLGANYTHEDNLYAENVDRALRWLVAQQESNGYLGGRANRYARMYCHGMATIALGEAYGMTKDSMLREPLVLAVQYIIDQQNVADGGWRYLKTPTQTGDMSMFGWQLMALKSAHTAGLKVPREPVQRAIEFLRSNSAELRTRGLSRSGGLAAYRREERPKPSMTAEALFCKQLLGTKRDDPAIVEAVEYLQQNLPRRTQQDLYYWYYGTLAMYHHGGEPWDRWNRAMRDNLVSDQRTDGDFTGSWNPRAPWGDYGGRVYSTALSTLCLEVYYRFLPLYQMSGRPGTTKIK
jgi:hypothetical protein